jgi:predicted naringenin-chalcone synthase
MAWIAAADGFRLRLAPDVPRALGQALPALTDRLLTGRARASCRWAVHPGGPRILDGVERTLGLAAGSLDASRAALAHGGNRSSGTVLAILDALCRESWAGPCAAYAFGPGLTAEGLLLERHPTGSLP